MKIARHIAIFLFVFSFSPSKNHILIRNHTKIMFFGTQMLY